MNSKNILLLVVLSLISFKGWSCTQDGTRGIVEENDLFIPDTGARSAGITEEKFNKVLDEIEAIYTDIIDGFGAELEVVRKWKDGTVNAYAQQSGKTWKISMFGGLARHETITADGFALVACHELGHHIGGAPKKKTSFGIRWASNEGQSDYWGAMKCMRRYLENKDNNAFLADKEIPAEVSSRCLEVYPGSTLSGYTADQAICLRTSLAGLSLANLFAALRKLNAPIKFETPSSKVTKKTDHSHPQPQCRLDTYFQGALCNKGYLDVVSQNDAKSGVCTRESLYENGIRPLCWFSPTEHSQKDSDGGKK